MDAFLEELEETPEEQEAPPNPEPPPAPEDPPETQDEEREPSARRAVLPSSRRLRRDRFLFYMATFLIAGGLFGLVLGSVLHDAARVPWFGTAYSVFGPLNVEAAAIGTVIAIIGFLFLRVALRGGVISDDAAQGA